MMKRVDSEWLKNNLFVFSESKLNWILSLGLVRNKVLA